MMEDLIRARCRAATAVVSSDAVFHSSNTIYIVTPLETLKALENVLRIFDMPGNCMSMGKNRFIWMRIFRNHTRLPAFMDDCSEGSDIGVLTQFLWGFSCI
jgi:hypothetical protein